MLFLPLFRRFFQESFFARNISSIYVFHISCLFTKLYPILYKARYSKVSTMNTNKTQRKSFSFIPEFPIPLTTVCKEYTFILNFHIPILYMRAMSTYIFVIVLIWFSLFPNPFVCFSIYSTFIYFQSSIQLKFSFSHLNCRDDVMCLLLEGLEWLVFFFIYFCFFF